MSQSNATTLLLIRHGQSQANLQRRFAGHWDVPLTELGQRQAQKTAAFVAEAYTVDAVYCSDLVRAADTGMAVAQKLGLPATFDPALREIYAGKWESLSREQLEHDPEFTGPWCTDIGSCCPPEGESVAALARRIEAALRRIAEENPGKTVVVATHATPIRAMQCLQSGQPLSAMKDVPWASNASVTELFYQDGAFTLGKLSQDDHLTGMISTLTSNS